VVDGEQMPGFQVHLGGSLAGQGQDAGGLGRTVRGLKVPSTEVADYVERIVRRFADERAAGETFASWALRADEEALV
jgi:sulfite reductase (ferredoxin)